MEQQTIDQEGIEDEPNKKRFLLPISNKRAIILLLVGLAIGAILKTQALRSITIGFDDYRLESLKSDYDLLHPKKPQTQKQSSEEPSPEQPVPTEPETAPVNP